MGLLDDAIREHLELKRRRGADTTEIEREEAEALGPVRRGEVDLADEHDALDGQYADEPAGLEDPGEAYADDDDPAAAAMPRDDGPPSDREPPPVAERPEVHDAPYAEDQDESATPPHGDPWIHQPTREFSADELHEALSDTDEPPATPRDPDVVPADDEGAGEGEDVLEETPEFLQETPEHDRLWFEQKPPKDFDF